MSRSRAAAARQVRDKIVALKAPLRKEAESGADTDEDDAMLDRPTEEKRRRRIQKLKATHSSLVLSDADTDDEPEQQREGRAQQAEAMRVQRQAREAVEHARARVRIRTRPTTVDDTVEAAIAAMDAAAAVDHGVMEDERPVDGERLRQMDHEHLIRFGKGLFPRGIESIQASRLFMGAQVEMVDRGMDRQAHAMTDRIWDQYRVTIVLGDTGFKHTIEAGYFVITFRGPRTGLHLDRFYGNTSVHVGDRLTWDAIERQSKLVLRKFMVSALRAFIQTHLLRHLFLSDKAPITLEAVSARAVNNSQERLLAYYRTLGFLPTDDAPLSPIGYTEMETTIERFLEHTEPLVKWTTDMHWVQSHFIQLPPDPRMWTHVYPLARVGAPPGSHV